MLRNYYELYQKDFKNWVLFLFLAETENPALRIAVVILVFLVGTKFHDSDIFSQIFKFMVNLAYKGILYFSLSYEFPRIQRSIYFYILN